MKFIYLFIFLSFSFIINAQNNVGIGTNTPNSSAKLDIDVTSDGAAAKKGLLIPRVALTSTSSASPVASPAVSLMVYNTATASSGATLVTPGFYYWNGAAWVRLLNTKTLAANNGLTVVNDTLVQLGGSLNQNTTIAQGSNTLAFTSSATNGFSVDGSTFSVDGANDRVGVGYTSPTEKLNVNGSVLIPDGASYWISNNANAGERLRMHHSGIQSYIDYASGDLNFRAGATPRVIFKANGDVQVNNLAGTGNRPVYANPTGVLATSTSADNSLWTMSANLASSPDDLAGSDLAYTGSADDGYNQYTMPFSYIIEGSSYSTITICTNGWIAFGSITSTSCCPSGGLPQTFTTNPVIYPFFTDLYDYGSGENIRAYNYGASPNRVVIVHYKMKAYCGASAPGSTWYLEFQVQIHENGLINVKYINMPAALNGQLWNCSIDRNTIIGFQLSGGSAAKVFPISYNAKVLDDNRMPESWSVSPVR